jgi:FkbM family methyltransferase
VAAGWLLGRHGRIGFRLHGGGRLSIDAADRYWIRHALFDRAYEPDVDSLLSAVLRKGDGFVDCGANIGIWSIAASQVIDDPGRVIAIESSTATFELLSHNWHQNDERFTPLKRALWDRDDETVTFYASATDPASSSALADLAPTNAHEETVHTVALRSLLKSVRSGRDGSDAASIIVVKLDVEGLESRLIATLDPSADDDVLVVYEDHGRDSTHATTASVLSKGFHVAFLYDGHLRPISAESVNELDTLKWNPLWGYNLVAAAGSGPAWRRLSTAYPDLV